MNLVLDEGDAYRTAKALMIMNPDGLKNANCSTIEQIIDFMKYMVEAHMKKSNMVSTCGFVLTKYKGYHEDKPCMKVRASVAGYMAEHYLSKMGAFNQ